MLVNKELTVRVLLAFLAISQREPGRLDPRDVQMVKAVPWWAVRFILVSDTEEEALKRLIETMEWRKSNGVNDLTENSFPKALRDEG